MIRVEILDGSGTVLLDYSTDHPEAVRVRSEVSTEKGYAVAWLEVDGEIVDSIEMDMSMQPSGLRRRDTPITFDAGGELPSGMRQIQNLTGQPEALIPGGSGATHCSEGTDTPDAP